MNQYELRSLVLRIPAEATEIIIKGRDAKQAFFTMPREWRPNDDQKKFISQAPLAMTYKIKGEGRNGNRWRIHES